MNWPGVVETLAKSLWAASGTLAGLLVGAYLTNRNQRVHWIADNKVREYQELVSALANAFSKMVLLAAAHEEQIPETDALRASQEAVHLVLITVNDRIFVEPRVREVKVQDRWQKLRMDFYKNYDIVELGGAFLKSRQILYMKRSSYSMPERLVGGRKRKTISSRADP